MALLSETEALSRRQLWSETTSPVLFRHAASCESCWGSNLNLPSRIPGHIGALAVICALICACLVDSMPQLKCCQSFLVVEALIDEQGLA